MNDFEIRINHCISILNIFPKDNKSLTIHVEEYFSNITLSEEDRLFIVDVFAETIRYHKILKVVVDEYYTKVTESVLERDRNLYMVIIFLIIFRLDFIGLDGLKQYLGRDRRTCLYLTFLTSREGLWQAVEARWLRMYDHTFVDNELMAGLSRWIPQLRSLAEAMVAASGVVRGAKKAAQTTKPEPFKLTRPKPKRIPMPELIPEMEKPREIPQSTYIQPDESKKPQKKDSRALIEEAERLKPSCADKGISAKTIEKLNKIVLDRQKELKFDGIKARPNPKVNTDSATALKLNTAAILREWKLYEGRQQKKMAELKKLEEGTFNSQQFQEWQQSVRAADLAEKISQIEKRRLEGKISYEEAILNRENIIQENKSLVESLKRETRKRMDKIAKERAVLKEQAKAQVEKIIASEEGAKEAKISVQAKNKAIAKEIAAESKRLQEEALIEIEAEMRRRIDIISEIRALEGSHSSNQKVVDHTQTAGYGLLCEMSLAELRERLSLCRRKAEEELSDKKDSINDSKQQKERQLADTLEMIELCRSRFKESSTDEKLVKNSEILNSEQLEELEILKGNLEVKKRQRQNKYNKTTASKNDNVILSNPSFSKEGTFDQLKPVGLSATAEKLAQMLSV